MTQRCTNKNTINFPSYGGKGVEVCPRWINSFENFLLDMGEKPTTNHTLDRFPNIFGNYEPSNCRWATRKEQDRGRTDNLWLEYNGTKMILSDWARELKTLPSNITRQMRQKNKKTFSQVVEYFKYKK